MRFSWKPLRIVVPAMLCITIGAASSARAAQVTLSAGSTPSVGTTAPIDVLVDPQGESINSVDLTLSFDPQRYAFSGYSAADTVVTFWASAPRLVGEGTVHFSGVMLGGVERSYDPHRPNDHAVPVARLLFTPRVAGEASFAVSEVALLRNDGRGTAVPVTAGRLSVTVRDGLPSSAPLDETPPLPFSIEIVERSVFADTPRLAVLTAVDEQSGIRGYEVRINGGNPIAVESGWYALPRRLFPYTLTARAIDFAGNYRDAQISVRGTATPALVAIALVALVAIVWYMRRARRRTISS